MYLKSVKARGFKSFGRPVEFGFEPGITVVVGPNGSGKSNIADAIVWAMGEQSPSALRGASMQDIIFTGSDKLAPAGMAEVEITFDNSSGQMPIEFSDVTVSRRVYRDGESAYFINRSACRLIDVAELLSDAGLGRDSHSIISQGKVDAILESKPEERRAHIEEAAGLGKFKKRRRRAELKLQAVNRNLERLADVEEEVRAQLRPLKRQATAAERSASLDLQIARARARLHQGRLELLNAELGGAEDASHQAAEMRAEIEEKLAATASDRRATEELMSQSLQAHKQLADRFYSLKSRRDGLETRSEALGGRRDMIAQGTKRAEARIENLKGQIERVRAELRRAETERSEGEARMKLLETELELSQQGLARLEEEAGLRRQATEEKNRRIGELTALKDRYQHQIDYLSQRREKLTGQIERAMLEAESHRRELTGLEQSSGLLEEKLAGWREKAAAAESSLSASVEQQAVLEGERQDLASELRRVAEDLQIAKSRLTFIQGSEEERSGFPPAAKHLSETHGISALFDLVVVEAGYERAVSAILGSTFFALVAGNIGEANSILREAMEAKLGSVELLLPQPGPVTDRREGEEYLIDHVAIPDAAVAGILRGLLSGVRIVDELNGFAGSSGDGVWVTRDGIVYHAGKRLLSYRVEQAASAVLRQRNERAQLEEEKLQAESRHAELEAEIARLDARLAETSAPRGEAEETVRRCVHEIEELEGSLASSGRRRQVLEQQAQIGEASRAQLEGELLKIEEELAEAQARLEDTLAKLAQAGSRMEKTEEQSDRVFTTNLEQNQNDSSSAAEAAVSRPVTEMTDEELTAARHAISARVTELQISSARYRERERVAAVAIGRTGPQLRRLERELAATTFELDAYRRLAPRCEQLLETIARLLTAFGAVLGRVGEELKTGEEEANRHSDALKRLSQAEAALQQELHLASDATTQREVGVTRLRDQVAEQESKLAALQSRFPDAALEEEAAATAEELPEVESQIERLERRRELIGPVNPLAQQEYEEMLERQKFLEEQRADLEASLKELKGLIRELTSRIESNFAQTFEAVQRNFTEVVATLFPGGEGRLSLVEPPAQAVLTQAGPADEEGYVAEEPEEEEAPAESFSGDRRGIEITVKPARKAVKSLSLLSGGERSLVAVAFLFAIFLARPAPFYILDEVEAALDDLNIDRLLNMLRRYQTRTQFLVITHQKRTMEVADVLYGVSMGADGTSTVLSRKMPEREDPPAGEPDDADPAADSETGTFDREAVVA
jgi:chromosome segregation protein